MKYLFCSLLFTLTINFSFADEGMWLPLLVEQKIDDMKKNGFELEADDIYSVNKACMKDAVILFGGGCTGEIISNQGLIITNHHCGESQILSHSTPKNDYFTIGFIARNFSEEISCKGLSVKILKSMSDITAKRNDLLLKKNISPENVEKILKDEAIKSVGNNYLISIEKFYAGNRYYLFVYKEFKDIRMVFAPPAATGSFGGDTDNWIWPRHTCDFSVFRIYADQNNNPCEYNADNKPYKPDYFFEISLKGVNEDDFTMILGYPGYTNKYQSSAVTARFKDVEAPARIFIRNNFIKIMDRAVEVSPDNRIKYTGAISRISNGAKKWTGSVKGLEKYNAVEKIIENENLALQKFPDSLKNIRNLFASAVNSNKENYKADIYINEIFNVPAYCNAFLMLRKILNSDCQTEKVKEDLKKIKLFYSDFDKHYDYQTETELLSAGLKMLKENLSKDYFPKNLHVAIEDRLSIISDNKKMSQTINSLTSAINSKSKTKIDKIKSEIKSDDVYNFLDQILNVYYQNSFLLSNEENNINLLNTLWQKSLLNYAPELIPYPEANLTMRFTYGKMKGLSPDDGIEYKPFTTSEGILQKYDSSSYDFRVPQKLLNLIKAKDFGRYADKDGTLHTCFLTSNHTTGGNSGSPVINSKGQLIGINFDRNWEGTMSDIVYNPDLCRNISVDIRYVLFVIDKFAGAKNIIDELKIAD